MNHSWTSILDELNEKTYLKTVIIVILDSPSLDISQYEFILRQFHEFHFITTVLTYFNYTSSAVNAFTFNIHPFLIINITEIVDYSFSSNARALMRQQIEWIKYDEALINLDDSLKAMRGALHRKHESSLVLIESGSRKDKNDKSILHSHKLLRKLTLFAIILGTAVLWNLCRVCFRKYSTANTFPKIMTHCWQGYLNTFISIKSAKFIDKIFMMSICLFTFVFMNELTTHLTSDVTRKAILGSDFQKIQHLIDHNITIFCDSKKPSHYAKYPELNKLIKSSTMQPWDFEEYQKLEEEIVAFLVKKSKAYWFLKSRYNYDKYGQPRFNVIKEELEPTPWAIKDEGLFVVMHKMLNLLVKEAALETYWNLKINYIDTDKKRRRKYGGRMMSSYRSTSGQDVISFNDFYHLFTIFLRGIALSVFVFICEILYYRYLDGRSIDWKKRFLLCISKAVQNIMVKFWRQLRSKIRVIRNARQ